MEYKEVINKRKSVRSYTGMKVTDEQLKALIDAAESAPVGGGAYNTVQITVVEDPEVIHEINKAAAEAFGKDDMVALYGAPTYIVVSAAPLGGMESVAYANGAMIVHNIALEATELGLGECCIYGALGALNARESLVKKLGIPEGQTAVASIIVGPTDETYEAREIDTNRIPVNYVR